MEDDWGAVPAHKRPEIRRRVAVVRRFLAIADPTPDDRARAVEELGLSRASFHNLVRAMRAGAGLAAIQGTGPAPGRTGGGTLDAVVTELIETAIRNVGAASNTADVHREVERLCALVGVTPPSTMTVRKRHLEAAKWLSPRHGATLLVDHCALLLPIDVDGRTVLPVVTAAFIEPEGLIVGYGMSFGHPVCTDIATVLLRCLQDQGLERRLRTHRMSGAGWNVLAEVFRSVGAPVPELRKRKGPGHDFRSVTGTTLGGIRLAIQSTMRPETASRKGIHPLDPRAARQVIDDAVRTHNAARGLVREQDAPPVGIGAPTASLRQGLEWIARMPSALVGTDD